MSQPETDRARNRVKTGLIAAAFALSAFLLAWAGGALAARLARDNLAEAAGPRRALYVAGLRSELTRHETLPAILALSQTLRRVLHAPDDPAAVAEANLYMERIADRTGAAALYLLDTGGTTLAASNWRRPDSFVGRNFAYRPYFREALAGGSGRFYGIGTTSREPGHYFARALEDGALTLGITVVKVSLAPVERSWAQAADPILVVDANGVVILSSNPDWTFRMLAAPTAAEQVRLADTRQYEGVRLRPLDWRPGPDGTASLAGLPDRYLVTGSAVEGTPWRLYLLSSLDGVDLARDIGRTAGVGLTALLALAWLYWRQRRRTRLAWRRAAAALEGQVAARTAELVAANQDLHRAQDGLVQAAKLAALGQLSAGITHELNQPLAALRTFSDNAATFLERGRLDRVAENLRHIAGLTERMARITGQLRTFARRSDNRPENVPLARAIDNALTLLVEKTRRTGAVMVIDLPEGLPAGGQVRCDPLRLEQVLVNLLGNALDAVAGAPVRRVRVTAGPAAAAGRLRLDIADSGPGIAPADMPRLFEPFFTTKAPGLGLGLGLVISAGIIRDHDGSLSAANGPDGGAVFSVELPVGEQA
ncbi:sensor histidine kinase [Niveispirillum fermenti]|uniref:sensor histidine kinase n=1 Tax=Niveispirillum fermenti TaxID=1233113 RepID=UPI003A8B45BF